MCWRTCAPQITDAARAVVASRPEDPAADAEVAPVGGPTDSTGLSPDERRVLSRLPATRGVGIERLAETCGLAPGPLPGDAPRAGAARPRAAASRDDDSRRRLSKI